MHGQRLVTTNANLITFICPPVHFCCLFCSPLLAAVFTNNPQNDSNESLMQALVCINLHTNTAAAGLSFFGSSMHSQMWLGSVHFSSFRWTANCESVARKLGVDEVDFNDFLSSSQLSVLSSRGINGLTQSIFN